MFLLKDGHSTVEIPDPQLKENMKRNLGGTIVAQPRISSNSDLTAGTDVTCEKDPDLYKLIPKVVQPAICTGASSSKSTHRDVSLRNIDPAEFQPINKQACNRSDHLLHGKSYQSCSKANAPSDCMKYTDEPNLQSLDGELKDVVSSLHKSNTQPDACNALHDSSNKRDVNIHREREIAQSSNPSQHNVAQRKKRKMDKKESKPNPVKRRRSRKDFSAKQENDLLMKNIKDKYFPEFFLVEVCGIPFQMDFTLRPKNEMDLPKLKEAYKNDYPLNAEFQENQEGGCEGNSGIGSSDTVNSLPTNIINSEELPKMNAARRNNNSELENTPQDFNIATANNSECSQPCYSDISDDDDDDVANDRHDQTRVNVDGHHVDTPPPNDQHFLKSAGNIVALEQGQSDDILIDTGGRGRERTVVGQPAQGEIIQKNRPEGDQVNEQAKGMSRMNSSKGKKAQGGIKQYIETPDKSKSYTTEKNDASCQSGSAQNQASGSQDNSLRLKDKDTPPQEKGTCYKAKVSYPLKELLKNKCLKGLFNTISNSSNKVSNSLATESNDAANLLPQLEEMKDFSTQTTDDAVKHADVKRKLRSKIQNKAKADKQIGPVRIEDIKVEPAVTINDSDSTEAFDPEATLKYGFNGAGGFMLQEAESQELGFNGRI